MAAAVMKQSKGKKTYLLFFRHCSVMLRKNMHRRASSELFKFNTLLLSEGEFIVSPWGYNIRYPRKNGAMLTSIPWVRWRWVKRKSRRVRVGYIRFDQNTLITRILVNTKLNLSMPQMRGNFLTSWQTVGFSERTTILGVSKYRPQNEMLC
jgi:hypothetical protein